MANATSDQWPQTSLIPHGEPPATEIWGKLQKLTVQDNARLGWVYIRYTLHELYVGEARFPRQIPWARGLADSSASVSDTATPRSSAAFCLRQRLIPPVEQAYRYRNAGVLADRSKANRQAGALSVNVPFVWPGQLLRLAVARRREIGRPSDKLRHPAHRGRSCRVLDSSSTLALDARR